MRFELGDRFDGSYAPQAATKDHKATFFRFVPETGETAYDIPAPQEGETPLSVLIVVFVPAGHDIPATADEFVALDVPKTQWTVDASHYGSQVGLERPETLEAGVQYLGQTIFGYES